MEERNLKMKQIYEKVIAGDVEGVQLLVRVALDAGKDPEKIIAEGLIAAMDEVGTRMRSGDMYVPEVLIAAEAMKQGLEIVKPLLGGVYETKGKIVVGTVAGDLHDIGKNLVKMLLESSGYEVDDLGVDVGTDKFIQAIEAHQPQIVGLSALLTTTMASMVETVKTIKEKYPTMKVIIGGAPINQEFADQINADGYGSDAAAAVSLCQQLLS
jgi:5-methyltetrahydrofolate--homocysteine methyltransferase